MQIMVQFPPPPGENPQLAMFMSAISIGMEVGYDLGQYEAKREVGPFK